MFATSRTESVRGRIIDLTNSIRTMKGINKLGEPVGTKWASII